MDSQALAGIKVLEIAGLAPAPFAGMVLADFGADVVRVDRVGKDGSPVATMDTLARGKRSIALDLKSQAGKEILKRMVQRADVLIEPFRPGVMERLGLGPEVLCAINPKLIFARMTGFGQGGDPKFSLAAGHDQNYLATSGALSALRRKGQKPTPPVNLLGDFAGGGFVCAMGVLLALLERHKSGKGQVIDAAMIDGANYVSMYIFRAWAFGQYANELDTVGTNLLDTGCPFYDTYECKDGQFLSVGCIEPQFFKVFIEKLGFTKQDLPRQSDRKNWPTMREKFTNVIATKTRDEWGDIFYGTDACAFPILSFEEAQNLNHNKLRNSFGPSADVEGKVEPMPAPKLSRTPGHSPRKSPQAGADAEKVLAEYGFSASDVTKFIAAKTVGNAKL